MTATTLSFSSDSFHACVPVWHGGSPHLVTLQRLSLGQAEKTPGIALLDPLLRGDAVHVRLRFDQLLALTTSR